MKLEDVEPKTDLMVTAMSQGIKTIEDYTVWLLGYTTGTDDAREHIMDRLKEGKL